MSHRHTACCLTEIVATAASRNPQRTLRLSPFKTFKGIPKRQHPQEGRPMPESSFLRGTTERKNASRAREAAQQAHRWPMLAAAADAQPPRFLHAWKMLPGRCTLVRRSREVQGSVVPGAPACSARRTPRSRHGPSSAAGSPQRGAPGIPEPRPVEFHYFQTNAGFFHIISHFFILSSVLGKKNWHVTTESRPIQSDSPRTSAEQYKRKLYAWYCS